MAGAEPGGSAHHLCRVKVNSLFGAFLRCVLEELGATSPEKKMSQLVLLKELIPLQRGRSASSS